MKAKGREVLRPDALTPTLLGSNFGTKSYVLRFLWNLLLPNSNSRLFSPGHMPSPRFLSLGKYMPSPGHTSAGNHVTFQFPRLSPREALPHAGDYSTLTLAPELTSPVLDVAAPT